jgi:hypothetical protein
MGAMGSAIQNVLNQQNQNKATPYQPQQITHANVPTFGQSGTGKAGPVGSGVNSGFLNNRLSSQEPNEPNVNGGTAAGADGPTFGQQNGKSSSGQRYTYSPTSGQPTMGSPNPYTNTVGQWDNVSIQQPNQQRSGKGKGG